jgi:hypothetical protein
LSHFQKRPTTGEFHIIGVRGDRQNVKYH